VLAQEFEGGHDVIKLRNRNADPAPAPPFEGHGPDGAERATFAAGCFWGVEAAFRQIHGVLQTAAGYTGGHVADPGYERVCRHRTGHAEAEVWSGPAQVSYAELLQAFWRIRNPTTRNRQGLDFGSQYRSATFCHDAGQMEAAIASRDAQQQSRRRQIVTQITPASAFLPGRGVPPAVPGEAWPPRLLSHHRVNGPGAGRKPASPARHRQRYRPITKAYR
jgi:peptide-methionine (S)-S-oxide reductase